MGYFPMCVDLSGKMLYLVGNGPQIREKAERLIPFSPKMVFLEDMAAEDLEQHPAMVIVGGTDFRCAERISRLCRERNIPVNVVDTPKLSTFFFPALIARGDLTVSVSTGGKSPAAAVCLRNRLEEHIPDRTDEILRWLSDNRRVFRQRGILRKAAEEAFLINRPLTAAECSRLADSATDAG
jgi:siroheme synthase (precorrin-2 oxidase/ferrochelatase)